MLNTLAKSKQKDAVAALQKAFTSGDENLVREAFEQFHQSVAEVVTQDYLEANGDSKVLAQRGYRQLTRAEQKFYENVIEAGKKQDYKQAFTSLLTIDGGMPETVIEDVYKDLIDDHPLLSKISFTNVAYLTQWILNDHTVDKAVWGEITEEITKEISSSFKTIDLEQCKLTAYCVIEKAMLDLGPVYLDNYIRTILKDALACGLEGATISGNGLNQPIGLDRDIHEGVSFSTETGYPQKTAVTLTEITPEAYGEVLKTLAVSEKGNKRKFDKVLFICNMEDYLEKVMPATTVQSALGTYISNVFPFPTEVVVSNEMATGKAIICLPEEYFFGLGSSKDGNVEFSDDFKFLEDKRTFKIKLYGNGRAYDNTISVLVDISSLEPAYVRVKDVTPTA